MKVRLVTLSLLLGFTPVSFGGSESITPLTIDTSRVTFTDLAGEKVSLEAFKGKVVLLNFWATWCVPCIREIPSMERLYQRRSGDSFEMIAVNSGESAEQINDFMPKLSIQPSFPILLDSDDSAYSSFNLKGMPTTYIIDHTGKVLHAVLGAKEWDSDEVVQSLDVLIKAAQAD